MRGARRVDEQQATVIFEGYPGISAFGHWLSRTNWKITTMIIQKNWGIFNPKTQIVELGKVRDIRYIETCGCCSSISIYVAAEEGQKESSEPEFTIVGIDNARGVYKALRDAITAIHSNAGESELLDESTA